MMKFTYKKNTTVFAELKNGNEGGRLLAKLVEWLHANRQEDNNDDNDDIDQIAEMVGEAIIETLECRTAIFTCPVTEVVHVHDPDIDIMGCYSDTKHQ